MLNILKYYKIPEDLAREYKLDQGIYCDRCPECRYIWIYPKTGLIRLVDHPTDTLDRLMLTTGDHDYLKDGWHETMQEINGKYQWMPDFSVPCYFTKYGRSPYPFVWKKSFGDPYYGTVYAKPNSKPWQRAIWKNWRTYKISKLNKYPIIQGFLQRFIQNLPEPVDLSKYIRPYDYYQTATKSKSRLVSEVCKKYDLCEP